MVTLIITYYLIDKIKNNTFYWQTEKDFKVRIPSLQVEILELILVFVIQSLTVK